MNSFESDLKRAVISVPFIAGVIIETIILFTSGFDSDLFKVSVPVQLHCLIPLHGIFRLSKRVCKGVCSKVWNKQLHYQQNTGMWNKWWLVRNAGMLHFLSI